MTNVERLIGKVGEAIDRAALDPTQWACVLDTICGSLPGTKGTIHVADMHDRSSLGVIQHGFDAKLLAEYEQHYAKLNPWMPMLAKSPALQALVSDERFPASSFRESEFYQDWLARVGGMDSAVGVKLVHEADRVGVIAIHYAPRLAERYNPRIARLLQSNVIRLRRAVDAARLAGSSGGSPAPVALGAFALPAFLLGGQGRLLDLNEPARRLIDTPAVSVGRDNTLRLGSAMLSERIAAAARQIAAGRGPWSDGVDWPVTVAGGRRFTLSLVAVREPATGRAPAFFAPVRLTLLLMRPCPDGDAAAQASLGQRFGLTPAERRLAVQLSAGLSLRQSAERLGIAYETARSQLKVVFAKTGTSRQAGLVALLARLPPAGGKV